MSLPDSDDFVPGSLLGRYELLLPIAKGGMGRVWAARLRGSGGFQKLVAVKTILKSCDDGRFDQMLLGEATLASLIRHPNVAQCLDFGEHAGTMYLVMEWVDGDPLDYVQRAAKAQGGVPTKVAANLLVQACMGLHAAHELTDDSGRVLGLVHRDVSPQNLLVTQAGALKVIDFGVATATARPTSASQQGEVVGKLSYMSPEQVRGEPVDRRTDVFALGVVAYMLTTGRHPFRAPTSTETVQRLCSTEAFVKPRALVADYPEQLEQVVLRALERDPERRFQSSAEMARAIEAALPRMASDLDVGEFMVAACGDHARQRWEGLRAALQRANAERSASVALAAAKVSEFSSLGAIEVGAARTTADEVTRRTASLKAELPRFRRRSRFWNGAALATAAAACFGLVSLLARPGSDTASSVGAANPAPQDPTPRREVPAVQPPAVTTEPPEDLDAGSSVSPEAGPAPAPKAERDQEPRAPRVPSAPSSLPKKSESQPLTAPEARPGSGWTPRAADRGKPSFDPLSRRK